MFGKPLLQYIIIVEERDTKEVTEGGRDIPEVRRQGGKQEGEETGMACVQLPSVHLIDAHDLARDLHTEGRYFLVDCRPVLAFNSCHISGAVNVNFTVMMKKRFIAGKIGLQDLVTTEEGKKKFKVCVQVNICMFVRWALIRI